jgi:hypothetical protein
MSAEGSRMLGRGATTTTVVVVGLASLGRPAQVEAAEPDKAMCAETYRHAQVQRKNGALKRARESLLVCVSDKCPSVMQPDCTRWLTEVEAALPSIAFAAKGLDGKDVTLVHVVMDGQSLTDTLDGKSIAVDPGSHVVRFEYGSEPPIEQTIIVREGEKARVVSVSWAKPQEGAAANGPAAARSGGSSAVGAWVLGGIGVAGLATFGVLAVHGMGRRSDLEKECFGSCRQDQVDSIKTEFVVADIALGVGVASIAVSAILFLSSGSSRGSGEKTASGRPIWLGLAPIKSGGSAGFSGRF